MQYSKRGTVTMFGKAWAAVRKLFSKSTLYAEGQTIFFESRNGKFKGCFHLYLDEDVETTWVDYFQATSQGYRYCGHFMLGEDHPRLLGVAICRERDAFESGEIINQIVENLADQGVFDDTDLRWGNSGNVPHDYTVILCNTYDFIW